MIVFASIRGIEPDYNWYYDACIKCAARIKIIAGRMFFARCNQSRNVVPRFKLHVQVMDNTGSTSFILFDCNVANYVGRGVQDLIDAQGQANTLRIKSSKCIVFRLLKRMILAITMFR